MSSSGTSSESGGKEVVSSPPPPSTALVRRMVSRMSVGGGGGGNNAARKREAEKQDQFLQKVKDMVTRNGYRVLVPKNNNGWVEAGKRNNVPISEWDGSYNTIVKPLEYAEMVAVINTLVSDIIEDPDQSKETMDQNGYMLYIPKSPQEKLINKTTKQTFALLLQQYSVEHDLLYLETANDLIAVSAELYETVDRRKHMTVVNQIIKMPESFYIDMTMAIREKFWPKNLVKIYVIPRCDFSKACDMYIPQGSYVVDCANRKIWPAFITARPIKAISDTLTKGVGHRVRHRHFLIVNKSQLAAVPKVCPCSMSLDEDGYLSVYFLNTDPIVVKGLFDCYNVNARDSGIETDVISMISILDPDNNTFNWEKNKDVLVQYMSVCLQLDSKHIIELIRTNVIQRKLSETVKSNIYNKLQSSYNFTSGELMSGFKR